MLAQFFMVGQTHIGVKFKKNYALDVTLTNHQFSILMVCLDMWSA